MDYYLPKSYRKFEDKWRGLPLKERLEIAEKELAYPFSKLYKTTDAPEFLAKELIHAENGRIEIASNIVSPN